MCIHPQYGTKHCPRTTKYSSIPSTAQAGHRNTRCVSIPRTAHTGRRTTEMWVHPRNSTQWLLHYPPQHVSDFASRAQMHKFFHNGSTTFTFFSDLKYSNVAWHGGARLQSQDCKFKVSLGYTARPTNQPVKHSGGTSGAHCRSPEPSAHL